MIRINLLSGAHHSANASAGGGEGFEASVDQGEIRKQGLFKLLVIILPAFCLWFYEFQNIPALRTDRNRLQRSLMEAQEHNAKYEVAVKEIKKFKDDEDRIQQRIQALEKLSRNRTNEIKLLKLIADVIPEKAWLTRVDVKSGNAVLAGLSLSNSDVNVLAERLKSNILIADLQLVRINEEKIEGRTHTRFEFACQMEAKK